MTVQHLQFGYCEVRGYKDVDLNVRKTVEYLIIQKWVSDGEHCSGYDKGSIGMCLVCVWCVFVGGVHACVYTHTCTRG